MKIVYTYCQCMHVVNGELFSLLFHWICSLLKNVRLSFSKWSNNTYLPRKLKDTSTHQRASMYHHSFSVTPPLNTLKLWHFRNSFFWHGAVSQYLFTQKVENLHLEYYYSLMSCYFLLEMRRRSEYSLWGGAPSKMV